MKAYRSLFAFALASVLSSACYATELLRAIPLSDQGFGSKASGMAELSNSSTLVVGHTLDAMGRSVPWAWDLDNDGIMMDTSPLPTPAGFQGTCVGAEELAGGHMLAMGNLIGTDARVHAVVWRRQPSGSWGMPELIAPNANQSRVTDDCGTSSGEALVSVNVYNGAHWMPSVSKINSLVINTEALPAAQGRDAMALGITCDDSGRVVVSGFVTLSNAVRKPAEWSRSSNTSSVLVALLVPQNTGGAANTAGIIGGEWLNAGYITRNGRMRGFEWGMNGDGPPLLPLSGFQDSVVLSLGDTMTRDFGHWVFGASTNPGGATAATGWVNDQPVPVQQLLTDPASVQEILGFQWGVGRGFQWGMGRGAVGQIRSAVGSQPQAAFFAVTDDNVAALTNNPVGIVFDTSTQRLTDLWHDDGNELRMRTEPARGQRQAVVNLTITPLDRSDVNQDWNFSLDTEAASETKGGCGSGTFQISAFCLSHNVMELGLGRELGCSTVIGADFGEGEHNYHDRTTGAMKVQVRFVHDGKKPTAFVLDRVRMRKTATSLAAAHHMKVTEVTK